MAVRALQRRSRDRRSSRRSTTLRSVARALLATLTLCLPWPLIADTEQAPTLADVDLTRAERLLVGGVVGGLEVASLEILTADDLFWIPLTPFGLLCGCQYSVESAEGVRFETPLGSAIVPWAEVARLDDELYLKETALEVHLATPLTFSRRQYSLTFDLPWRPGAGADPAPRPDLIPELFPPRLSLSTFEADLTYNRFDSGSRRLGTFRLGGHLAGGYWRTRYEEDFDGQSRIRDYGWLRQVDRSLYLLGNQRVQLHPMLSGLELTGVQAAWTNQPLELFARPTDPRELLPRRLRGQETIRGEGPAGGLAELRVNDAVVARQTISLNGTYTFLDVPLAARRLSRIEVLVYDRYNLSVPVAIHERSRSASEFLLPGGAIMHQGGVGSLGNPIDVGALAAQSDSRLSGFYQLRYGLSERVTLETAAQQAGDDGQLMAGLVARVGRSSFLSAGLGSSRGALSHDLSFETLKPRFRLLARSQAAESGFRGPVSDESYDHYAELVLRPSGRLESGLIGRVRQQGDERVDFLLPTLGWRPTDRLSLRARPDTEGKYRLDLSYQPAAVLRLAASRAQSRTYLDLSWQLASRYHLSLGSDIEDGGARRESAVLSWYGEGRRRASWSAGALHTEGGLGYLVGAGLTLRPGVLASLQFESSSLLNAPGEPDEKRLFLSLTTDLALAGRRVLPANSYSVREDRGAVAGVIRVDGAVPGTRYALDGVAVSMDGRVVTRTDHRGEFFIGQVAAGNHTITLDHENLPIELTPTRSSYVAKTSAAAVTRVDFVVRPEFRIAGRVIGAGGQPLSGVRLELHGGRGDLVTSVVTDTFGLYRIDGLPAGIYSLSAPRLEVGACGGFARRVIVRDAFLFDQDLVVESLSGTGRSIRGRTGSSADGRGATASCDGAAASRASNSRRSSG